MRTPRSSSSTPSLVAGKAIGVVTVVGVDGAEVAEEEAEVVVEQGSSRKNPRGRSSSSCEDLNRMTRGRHIRTSHRFRQSWSLAQ